MLRTGGKDAAPAELLVSALDAAALEGGRILFGDLALEVFELGRVAEGLRVHVGHEGVTRVQRDGGHGAAPGSCHLAELFNDLVAGERVDRRKRLEALAVAVELRQEVTQCRKEPACLKRLMVRL